MSENKKIQYHYEDLFCISVCGISRYLSQIAMQQNFSYRLRRETISKDNAINARQRYRHDGDINQDNFAMLRHAKPMLIISS